MTSAWIRTLVEKMLLVQTFLVVTNVLVTRDLMVIHTPVVSIHVMLSNVVLILTVKFWMAIKLPVCATLDTHSIHPM